MISMILFMRIKIRSIKFLSRFKTKSLLSELKKPPKLGYIFEKTANLTAKLHCETQEQFRP